uniref:Uncharacterized protein n=1 Tax=Arundo donax TaxID=35708 RepID=A0A0A9FMW2_ARUDO
MSMAKICRPPQKKLLLSVDCC